jgi:hypothetical protein
MANPRNVSEAHPCPDHHPKVPLVEYVDFRFTSMGELLGERVRSLEIRIDERYHIQEKNIEEAKRIVDGRLAEMNNLRFQIEGERKTYVTKGEFTVAGIVAVGVGVLASLIKWAF